MSKRRIFETDIRLRADDRLRASLEEAAKREATSVSEYVRRSLRRQLGLPGGLAQSAAG